MKKEELRKLRRLYATDSMMQKAGMDVPVKKRYGNSYVNHYKYGLYLRCQILGGILKVAFFLAENMRSGSNKPTYELFINNESGEFITWDVLHEKWREAKLDMLDWPEYVRYSGKYINPEGNKSIKTYLEAQSGGYKGLFEYQLHVRKDQLRQKHKRETDPWDLAMEQIPDLPKDWKHWVDKCGLHQNYIFYEYSKKGATEGYCTWCEKVVPISKPKHNTFGKCKCCGHEIQYKSRGKAGCFYTDDETVYLIQRCEDGFVIRKFRARRHYFKGKYETPEKSYFEDRRVIYDKNLSTKIFYHGMYKQMESRWIETEYMRSYYDARKGAVYKRTIPSLANAELQRTGLPQMIYGAEKIDPEVYLFAEKRYPYLERLAKAGLVRLVCDVAFNEKKLDIKNERDLGKALSIDKYRLGRIRENNGGVAFLHWLEFEKLNKKVIDDSVISLFEQWSIRPKDLDFICTRMSEKKICNFLKKQYRLSGRKPKELLSTWEDYLCMANRLKMDTKTELIYKPRDLVKSHDEAVKLCGGEETAKRAGAIAEKFPDIDTICQSIKAKYEFSDKKYAIIVPDRIEDIINEGQILGHCLDRSDIYFERIQQRESYIVFLRKSEELDKPYYTLEIEPGGSARQKRTTGDKQNSDFEEAKRFIQKWQIEIQKRLSAEDIRLASESAKLRVEEFKELRKTKKKVWHGALAGKLLVDVLEADLMEVAVADRRCG